MTMTSRPHLALAHSPGLPGPSGADEDHARTVSAAVAEAYDFIVMSAARWSRAGHRAGSLAFMLYDAAMVSGQPDGPNGPWNGAIPWRALPSGGAVGSLPLAHVPPVLAACFAGGTQRFAERRLLDWVTDPPGGNRALVLWMQGRPDGSGITRDIIPAWVDLPALNLRAV